MVFFALRKSSLSESYCSISALFYSKKSVQLLAVLKQVFLDMFEGSLAFLVEFGFLLVLRNLINIVGLELGLVDFVFLESSFKSF
jgi:hypothetical protein